MMAFYKTPLGKKMIEQEPQAGEDFDQACAGLDRQVSPKT